MTKNYNIMKLYLYFIIFLLTGCFGDENNISQKKQYLENRQIMSNAKELLTVSIPSEISDAKLEITLPRCFINEDEIKNEIINNRVETPFVELVYPLAAFIASDFPDNENDTSLCPNGHMPLIGFSVGPLFPVKSDQHNQSDNENYWLKFSNSTWAYRVEEKRNNQALYTKGAGGKLAMFVDKSKKNKEDFQIEFWPYKFDPTSPDESDDMFPSQIDVRSVMNKEFSFNYVVYASPPLKNLNPPIKGAKFADDLLTIYKNNESLLDHQEVLDGFIINNNNILNYLNQHIKIVNKEGI